MHPTGCERGVHVLRLLFFFFFGGGGGGVVRVSGMLRLGRRAVQLGPSRAWVMGLMLPMPSAQSP